MKKRLMAILLSAVMVFSLLPTAALAVEDPAAAPTAPAAPAAVKIVASATKFAAAVEAGGEVKLGANITVDLAAQPTITVDKAVTIDCNGHTLTITGGNYSNSVFNVAETGDLTLVNAKIKQENGSTIRPNAGKVTVRSTQGAGIEVNTFIDTNSGTLTVVDGTISAKSAIVNESHGNIDIQGGTFRSEYNCFNSISNQSDDRSFKVRNATITAGGSGKCVYFSNAYFNNEISNTVLNSADGDCVSLRYATVALRGVTATSVNGTCVYVSSGSAEIFGGEYTAKDDCVYAGGTVTLHVGATFKATADTGNGCLTAGSYEKFEFADDAVPDPKEWETAAVVKTVTSAVKIDFYSEGSSFASIYEPPANRKFPDTNPTHSAGYAFCYWVDAAGNKVEEEDLCKLTAATTLYAVFADKTYTVTFNDNGTTKTETVLVNTPLGQVPGLDRTDNGDKFYGWRLGKEIVNAATTMPVQSDLTLTAAYANTAVTNYAELQAAVTAKKPVIVLNDDIDDFTGSVTIDYPCIIEGNGHGLIRPDGFADVLLVAKGANASVTINNALADGQKIEADASALEVTDGAALTLNKVTVQNNTKTYGEGGGIYIYEGSLRMTDCVVQNNYSEDYGGGICVRYAVSTVVLTNCTIEGNQNKCCGGGIYINDSPAVLTNCQILNNSAWYIDDGHYGGGMYAENSDGSPVTMTDCTVLGNRAGWNGGGLKLCGGKITVTDCLVAENTTDSNGGGVYADDGDIRFVNCTIRDNRTEGKGGGIYVDDPTTLENCIIRDNHAVKAGGGVCVGYEKCTFIGGMLFDNTSDKAGDDLWQDTDEARSIYSTQGTRLNGDGNSTARGTVLTAPIPGYYPAAPGTVNIPWYGWFVDGEEDAARNIVNRYTNRDTGKLVSAANGNLDILAGDAKDVGIKAIWYGLLLAYDANYPGTTEHRYDAQGYVSGTNAAVADNTFSRAGYRFTGWNTKADGTGTAYTVGGTLPMDKSQVLYAQWEKRSSGHSSSSSSGGGTLDLIKTDAADKKTYLPCAKFEIYDSNGKLVGTYTTDEKGQIKVPGLASGKYYAVETIPPKGYLQDGAKHEFTISNGKVTTLVLTGTRTGVPDMLNGDDHFAYIIGRSDGLVHPDAPITRAEVTTIFFRLLDPTVRDANLSYTNTFSDVNADLWCNTAISTMTKLGIVHGRTASTFDPNAFITRAEFAAIAARFDKSSVSQLANFSDISGHWAALEISKAAANGWVNGYSDGTFKPDRNITRAEAMALINRVLNRVPETVNDLLPDMVTWPDNMNTSAWCYLDVQEATNSHDYERKSNGCETWTKLTKVPDWKIYEN